MCVYPCISSEQVEQERSLRRQQAQTISKLQAEMCALRAELEQEKSHSADILDAANEMESRMSRLCLHIKAKDEQIIQLKAVKSQVS